MKLPSLQDVHIVVVGDVMLDRYWFGEARRVSQEAPVPVVAVDQVENRPGGAANVALNIVSLGARCTLIGAVGDDEAAASLRETLEAAGVRCALLPVPGWSTVIKLRVVSQKQQLLRTDFEAPLPEILMDRLGPLVRECLTDAAALVLQDYDKGTLTEPARLIGLAASRSCPVVVDPKFKPFSAYRGSTIVKPNASEFEHAVGPWRDDDELLEKACALACEHQIGSLVITRGGRGSTVVQADGTHQHIPARPVDVFDVTGAGDTSAAALAVTAAVGWNAVDSARVANVASGIVVGKTGTSVVTGPELANALGTDDRPDRGVLNRSQLADSVSRARAAGEVIVFTNGCFDILHAGHVAYLEEARSLGDRLVVAVNDDASVRRLKGVGRPVNPLDQRLRVLSGLAAVDWVVGFDEDTPEPLLELLAPDVLVKGGDYGVDEVVGADIVTHRGGRVRVLSLVEDCSTTAIVDRIQQQD
ncbi:MAG: bifunctional D-glycero-beta-D-manno-heptose-7-phosphate kinase/D-glycero-beta-D-manno-heptose 1-phosphate adenylyltransferase HldE [Gammaproteobacteria bacterium]|nr:MAG: bifunctional D-glycero-beta-D-manno-heptose-7-phosphate kinase/D-glycero-beta-D-manno-heptose 1-phosphate adenylyltransferase HldE [Gammaproteobacteria bacterium]